MSYDINVVRTELLENGLNPFGTGQCLTTRKALKTLLYFLMSQSLWNRAVSYDFISISKAC